MMIGCLVLTTPRSGSSWLSAMVRKTGTMGQCDEWLRSSRLGKNLRNNSSAALTEALVEKAATGNGRFSVKIFPSHVRRTYRILKTDIIRDVSEAHSVSCLVLHRRDRLRQAISLLRSETTGEWSAGRTTTRKAEYDFDGLCKCYFRLEQDNSFWSSYLGLLDIDYKLFYYEDMLDTPQPCLDWMATRLGVDPIRQLPETDFAIQRDRTTEEWVERFRRDARNAHVLRYASGRTPPARTASNLIRFFAREPLQ